MSDDISAIEGTRRTAKEMADGTLRISIDIEPRHKKEFHKLFPDIDMPVVIAPMKPVAEGLVTDRKYGQQARELRQSDFFRRPDVWRAVGTDDEFLDWLKTQDCAFKSRLCSGQIVPMHVRRVANGAGMGIKPEYSAIPGCNIHHGMQHQHGESACAPREEWDKKRIEYVQQWCWEALKYQLSYDSWANVPPWILRDWADEHDVSGSDGNLWLPLSYYENYLEEK